MEENYNIAVQLISNNRFSEAALILYKLYISANHNLNHIDEHEFYVYLIKAIRKGEAEPGRSQDIELAWLETFNYNAYLVCYNIATQALTKFPNSRIICSEKYWIILKADGKIPYEFETIINEIDELNNDVLKTHYLLSELRKQLNFSTTRLNNSQDGFIELSYQEFSERLKRNIYEKEELGVSREIFLQKLTTLIERIDQNVILQHEATIRSFLKIAPKFYYAQQNASASINILRKFKHHLNHTHQEVFAECLLKSCNFNFSSILDYYSSALNIREADRIQKFIVEYVEFKLPPHEFISIGALLKSMFTDDLYGDINMDHKMLDDYTDRFGFNINWDRLRCDFGADDKKLILSCCFILLEKEIEYHQKNHNINRSLPDTIRVSDIAQFVFCPASLSINKTFVIQSNEFQELGIEHHNNSYIAEIKRRYNLELFLTPDMQNVDEEFPILNFTITTVPQNFSPNSFDRNVFLNDLRNGEQIHAGHAGGVNFINNQLQLVGNPDFIYQNANGEKFVIEEKYTSHKQPVDEVYKNHKVQLLSYIYGLSDHHISYGYIVYWEINRYDKRLARVSLFRLDRSPDNEQLFWSSLNGYQNFERERLTQLNHLNFNKCKKCSVNYLCKHKYGHIAPVRFPYNTTA